LEAESAAITPAKAAAEQRVATAAQEIAAAEQEVAVAEKAEEASKLQLTEHLARQNEIVENLKKLRIRVDQMRDRLRKAELEETAALDAKLEVLKELEGAGTDSVVEVTASEPVMDEEQEDDEDFGDSGIAHERSSSDDRGNTPA
jgi:hypothetical protein